MTRMEGGGLGMHHKGYYHEQLHSAYSQGFRCHPAELSCKLTLDQIPTKKQ